MKQGRRSKLPLATQYQNLGAQKQEPLQVNLELGPDLPAIINADRECLDQCLSNLLTNTLKFTERGSITLSCHTRGNSLCFEVTDTGPGIASELKNKMLERFVPADNTRTRRHGGPGPGLSITKSLVELMGGEISLETTDDRSHGSLFSFTLPIDEYENTATAKEPSKQKGLEKLTSSELLIVEDDEFNQIVLTKILESEGCRITSVDNAEAAKERCKKTPFPKIVFTDVHMPGTSGLDYTRELKKLCPELPIVIQSASVSDRENAKSAGADAFLANADAMMMLDRLAGDRVSEPQA